MNIFLKGSLLQGKKLGFISLIIFCAIIAWLFLRPRLVDHRNDLVLSFGEQELQTQIADSTPERTIGLSRHQILEDNQAMLFVFDEPGYYGFHMPDMRFSIDIFWLNKNKEIIFIQNNAHPDDYPEVYVPTEPALYVVETIDTFSEDFSVQLGDRFDW